jgi:transcriptional regulator with XRE-family HTH domain
MEINALTAIKIKELRNIQGIKAKAMASELGISEGTYSQLENGKVEITVSRLKQLSEILNQPISAFLNEQSGSVFNIDKVENSTINGTQVNNYNDKELVEAVNQTINVMKNVVERLNKKE